ncbi:pNRC100 replication protein H-like protein [Haloarcula amylolytica JCM 13557]|uniref:PNRC100 replication protein H-like protein n=1 Tax=Haloarcula amylolytica JCM 13557 TaxID=1227452 RepID=M0K445_9EURY|nr:pNRC100 replication protein H-like protein [Haloarcula amylolytica JCM 13557]
MDTTAYGPAFSDEMAVIAEVLYELGHWEIDYGGELTLAVTGRGDRFDEWLELHPDVRPVLSLVAHLQGTTLEKLTETGDTVRYQPLKSVVLGLDPDPTTTQTSLVNSAN